MVRVKEAVVRYKYHGARMEKIPDPSFAFKFFQKRLSGATKESMHVVYMNGNLEVVAFEDVGLGCFNHCSVEAKSIVRTALLVGGESILLLHNHPSGNLVPSPEDCEATKCICNCCKVFGIQVIDHLIIFENEYLSMKERGYLDGEAGK